jgi:NAD(P)H dehydrogenase (quinone)
METSINVAVVYYSATGSVFALAKAAATAAEKAGAEVRLRKVRELAPDEAIATSRGWSDHVAATQHISEAAPEDLEWADVILLGSPTRFGLPAAQLKQFIDTTGPLWGQGRLVDKVGSSFTSTATAHGGQESTILAMNNTFYHWGCIIVPLGYTLSEVFNETGNPYGTSYTSGHSVAGPDEQTLRVARHQGSRLARVTALIA